jgi:hypothetical protein
VKVHWALPVAGFQIRTSPAVPAEASQDPSSAATKEDTPLVWPVITRESTGWGRSGSVVRARRCGVVSPATNSSASALASPPAGSRVAPHISLFRRQLPPHARPIHFGNEAAVGVDQRPIQLAASVAGLLTQVSADDVVQRHPLRIAAIITDQSQPVQATAVPADLGLRTAAGGFPIPSQHQTGDLHIFPEHRQLQVAIPLIAGQPAQADLDCPSHRAVAFVIVDDIQRGRT